MAMIGLLPGTFDPVHLGHVALAQAARRAGGLDEVWLLVDPQPAYKFNVLSYDQRFEMAKLATSGTEGVSAEAVPVEARRWPHAMAGFARLMERHPAHRFVFVVGIDTMGRLDTWDDYQRVVEGATFLVARRRGMGGAVIEELRRRLGVLGARLDARLFEFDEFSGASSTVARAEVRAGKVPAQLDPRVYAYIMEHGLYR
jgi:nicotinate-nucleotide adenylyltransferase